MIEETPGGSARGEAAATPVVTPDTSAIGSAQPLSKAAPLLLRPLKSALVSKLLTAENLLKDLMQGCGSPLNILLPDQLEGNIASFRRVLASHRLPGRICFAHKSSQSHSLIAQLAASDVCADVASLDELRHALSAGFGGTRIEATGPKNIDFIALCLMHDVAINVDSLQELDDVCKVQAALGSKSTVRILLRLCGFSAAHTAVLSKTSRFGIPFSELGKALNVVAQRKQLQLLGFSFHLDSVSIDERVVAIENCIEAFEQSIALGLEPSVLNIGGGFRINYLESEADWNAYTSAIKQAVLGNGVPLTWQNNFFGLSAEGGKLRGKLNSYGYFEPRPGALFLDDLLNAELPGLNNQKVADALRDNMIEIWLEPGRALVDQCGVTIARVNSVKTSSSGDVIVGLNMKRQDIAFLDQEVFVDPVIIGQTTNSGSQPVFFAGNLCLENDLIFRHKVFLDAVPEPGAIVAFVNTAAYMMDFSSTRSIMQPPARKVAVMQDNDRFIWMLDELYTPVWRLSR